jgi:hypothetical protein
MAMLWRNRTTVALSDALKEFRATACKIATGKTLRDWEQVFEERRTDGIRSGHLNSSRIFYPWSTTENRFNSYYDLPRGAWELVVMKVDPLHDLPKDIRDAVNIGGMPLIVASREHLRDINSYMYSKSPYQEYELPRWLLVKRISKQYLNTI